MLVSKEKRPDGKGFKCTYDKPRTPCQRVLDEHVLTPEQETALMTQKARLGGMELYRRVVKRLRRIRRMQAAYGKAKHAGEDLSPFAARPALALCDTPSGTAGLHREGTRHTSCSRHEKIWAPRHTLSIWQTGALLLYATLRMETPPPDSGRALCQYRAKGKVVQLNERASAARINSLYYAPSTGTRDD